MASNTGSNDSFGFSVALSADTLAVGARYENSAAKGIDGDQSNVSAKNAGAVYIYARTGGGWSQKAYVKASNTRSLSFFGTVLALSGDTLVVGAPGESSSATGVGVDSTDTAALRSGAVYVFARTSGVWSQQAYLKASNTRALASFGQSVAIGADVVVVGAPLEDSSGTGVGGDPRSAGLSGAGAAYVFRRASGTWTQRAYVKPPRTVAGMHFATSIAVSGDALLLGAPADAAGPATAPGAVFAY
jgi:hypothetical protein